MLNKNYSMYVEHRHRERLLIGTVGYKPYKGSLAYYTTLA